LISLRQPLQNFIFHSNKKEGKGEDNHHQLHLRMFFLPYGLRAFIASFTFFCCNLYAAYHSYKALRHRKLDSTTHWLFYWSLVACFLIVDKTPLIHEILHTVIPFYPEIRIGVHWFTIHHPTQALDHLSKWINVVAEAINLKYWISFVLLLAVRGLRNIVKMGILDDTDATTIEDLTRAINEVSFDVAVVRNKIRRSSVTQQQALNGGDLSVPELVKGRRSLHSSHLL
jgi:hypothetical protein